MPECPWASARRTRAAPLWPGTRGCSCENAQIRQRPLSRAMTALFLPKVRRDLLTGFDQTLHRGGRLVELGALPARQLKLDNALDALGADHHRHADIKPFDAVLAIQPGGAG